jgi:hypothetical protein
MTAIRAHGPIVIDGKLEDPDWQLAGPVSDFTELKPNPGIRSSIQSKVRVLYDDTGIYIGAELDEPEMDQIGNLLFERDNLDDTKKIDWFAVIIDCYQNGLNGFAFVVSASGVQADIKFNGSSDDVAWDAVWDSKVTLQDNHWVSELKIPYSALRFPDQQEQRWGIQFGRRSHHRQEESYWNPVSPDIQGLMPQNGIIDSIKNIQPPARLSATPYLSVYAENYIDPNAATRTSWGSSYNGGMDIKYGISDAYTMDMTLIPDFGQVQSDNQVLNLSPFEVQFEENRQFFTEGTELFNKAGLFYSRRVGGTPFYYSHVYENLAENEQIDEIKRDSRLINATKISGRSKGGMGLGFFNAVAPRDYAIIQNSQTGERRNEILQPWTNYNVTVFDQNLKNNSYIALVNTNVWREGQAYDANVTGLEFDLRDNNNIYGISGSSAISQKLYPGKDNIGFRYNLRIARNNGNLNWDLGHLVTSDTYDPNDLGFLFINNQSTWLGSVGYHKYDPFGPFLKAGAGINLRQTSLYKFPGAPEEQVRPNLFTDANVEVWANGLFKNYYDLTVWINTVPFENYDYFEPRVPGRFFAYPAYKNIGININSDTRKKFMVGINSRLTKFHEKTKHQFNYDGYFNYRINNHFSLRYEYSRLFMRLDRGYITEEGDNIIFGARDYKDITHYLQANYTFNPNLTLSFRLRHNWTRVQYTHFYNLQWDGSVVERSYDKNEDINFNAWTIDTNLRWRFAPGSDLYVVWKNAIFGYNRESDISFSENLDQLFQNPQSNSFSVKAIYYFDLQRL